jgi:hypothetical protein
MDLASRVSFVTSVSLPGAIFYALSNDFRDASTPAASI